jgi:hypothetical protein
MPFSLPGSGLRMRAMTEEPHFRQNFRFQLAFISFRGRIGLLLALTKCVTRLFPNSYAVKEPLP